jgi:hypothetical protein
MNTETEDANRPSNLLAAVFMGPGLRRGDSEGDSSRSPYIGCDGRGPGVMKSSSTFQRPPTCLCQTVR